jgi:hypothetical protein
MHRGRTVFAQVMERLPKYDFDGCVRRYGGNRRVRRLSCCDQFLILAIAVYVLVAIIRKELQLSHSPYSILQILSVTLFEKTSMQQGFSRISTMPEDPSNTNQLHFQGLLTGQ